MRKSSKTRSIKQDNVVEVQCSLVWKHNHSHCKVSAYFLQLKQHNLKTSTPLCM